MTEKHRQALAWIKNLIDGSHADSSYLSNGMPAGIGMTILETLDKPVEEFCNRSYLMGVMDAKMGKPEPVDEGMPSQSNNAENDKQTGLTITHDEQWMPGYELLLLIQEAQKFDRRECFADSGNGFAASMEYSNMLNALKSRADLKPPSIEPELLAAAKAVLEFQSIGNLAKLSVAINKQENGS